MYQDGNPPAIVGIVERLQTPRRSDSDWAFNSVLEPLRADGAHAGYVVRARRGREQAAMREVRKALLAVGPMRVMPEPWAGIHSFSEIRARAYRPGRGMVLLMGMVCLIVLCVTAAGIVGLTSSWVVQRYRQIGVRWALGARRIDIVRYFQIENLFIAGGGVAAGLLFAFGLNAWLMAITRWRVFRLATQPSVCLPCSRSARQAVLVPARRASNVPLVVATRTV